MYEQVKLNYSFDALEPYVDTLTMETHYGKHHATYTKTLNEAAEKAGVSDKPIEEVLSNLDSIADETLRKMVRNNGGGYYNHNLYFSTMSPNPQKEPDDNLKAQIEKDFGGFDEVKDLLKKAAISQFGSGWAWLSKDKDGKLYVTQTANQDNPFSDGTGLTPILAIDVWEHAYYLKYKNLRASYVDAFFEVLDWKAVSDNYNK